MQPKNTRIMIGILAAALVISAALLFVFRSNLSTWAFNRTGEEAPAGQARALALLAIDNLRRQPVTAPDLTPVNYAEVCPFGINTFIHNEVEEWKREEIVRLISEAGFCYVREEFPWEDIEVSGPGDFIDRRNDPDGVDAWAKYDQIVDLVDQYDMDLIVRLSNPPQWAHPGDTSGLPGPPDNFADFANFAAAVAERYAGRVTYYQVWNEPNIYPEWGSNTVDPDAYTDLLCQAYHAIKEANPDAVVISGALAPTAEVSGRDFNDFLFLDRMYEAGAAECFDVLAVQGYGLWSGPTDHRMRPLIVNYARNQYIRDIMVRNNDAHKAIWISEMNWNVAPEDVEARYGRVTLEQQARYAPLAYLRAEQEWPWIGTVNFWYFKRADWTWLENGQPEAYFQVTDPDFNLMPVYDSLKNYITDARIMYAGWHHASHWAVDYGVGWDIPASYPFSRRATAEADPATVTFEGREITIHIEGADTLETSGIHYRVDGDDWISVDAAAPDGANTWRGRRGQHTLEIEPFGEPTLLSYHVIDRRSFDFPLVELLLIGGVIGLYLLWMRDRNARATAQTEAGE